MDSARSEGVLVKSLDEIHEPIDPRISSSSIPDAEVLDEGLAHQLSDIVRHPGDLQHHHHHRHLDVVSAKDENSISDEKTIPVEDEEALYVEFDTGDKRNPINFASKKKWAITYMACAFTLLSASSAGSYNLGFPSMTRDLNCTEFQASVGLSVYALGFAVVPLVSASFSEEFGRQPLYIGSAALFLLMHIMVALSKNIQTVIIARFLAGAFGSTGSTMVGGTVADIWSPHERGLPMSIFALTALGGMGLGPLIGGWIEMNHHLEWRWIQWIHAIMCGVYLILVPIIMRETRASILLMRIARRIRKNSGDHRYRARVEDERASLRTLVYISCTRPIHLLLTEPTVLSFSLWIGFAWGVIYGLIESISGVFKNLHNFNSGQVGTACISIIIGTILGFFTNMYQETLYQKYFPKKGPEARLYAACVAAILLPVGMFIYAWSSFPNVHWMALIVGITLFIWATFIIYLAVFTYLADCYGPFASSALAGQSLLRNLMAMAFPLFTPQMFAKVTYKWGCTIFACIALLMVPIPYVLLLYGPTIRGRSKFSRMVLEQIKA